MYRGMGYGRHLIGFLVGLEPRHWWLCLFAISIFTAYAKHVDATPLRYKATVGDTWHYQVEIHVQKSDCVDIWEGILRYQVKAVREDELEFAASDDLVRRRHHPDGQPVLGLPPGPRGFFLPAPFATGRPTSAALILSPRGKLREGQSLVPLPYLLGYKQLLVFEPLPEDERSAWTIEETIHVVLSEDLGPIFGPIGIGQVNREVSRLPASERSKYRVESSSQEGIVIHKSVYLRTEQEVDGRPRFEASGRGTFVFDPQLGRIRRLSYEYTITENEKLRTLRAVATIQASLMSPEQVAEWQKKRAEAQAAARVKLAELHKPRPLQPGEADALMEDLRSGDPLRQQRALDRLAQAEREDPAEPICQAILPLLEHQDWPMRHRAGRALRVWATPDVEEKLLLIAASDNSPLVAGEVMLVLARLGSPSSIQFLVSRLGRHPQAAQALKQIGTSAEEALLEELSRSQPGLRLFLLDVLAEVGTEKSLAVLKQMAEGAPDRLLFEKTISAIERRLGQARTGPASPSPDARKQ